MERENPPRNESFTHSDLNVDGHEGLDGGGSRVECVLDHVLL